MVSTSRLRIIGTNRLQVTDWQLAIQRLMHYALCAI